MWMNSSISITTFCFSFTNCSKCQVGLTLIFFHCYENYHHGWTFVAEKMALNSFNYFQTKIFAEYFYNIRNRNLPRRLLTGNSGVKNFWCHFFHDKCSILIIINWSLFQIFSFVIFCSVAYVLKRFIIPYSFIPLFLLFVTVILLFKGNWKTV